MPSDVSAPQGPFSRGRNYTARIRKQVPSRCAGNVAGLSLAFAQQRPLLAEEQGLVLEGGCCSTHQIGSRCPTLQPAPQNWKKSGALKAWPGWAHLREGKRDCEHLRDIRRHPGVLAPFAEQSRQLNQSACTCQGVRVCV